MYDTGGSISIVSAYGCDVYANVQKNFHKKQHNMKILSSLCVVHTQDTLFDAVELQQRYRKNPSELGDANLMLSPQRVQ